jgi:mono/diheme cytochrome c family protein
VNNREKEQYLREYSLLKNKGEPFFPYTVYKDGVMAIVTLGVMILMAVVLGAELGPKADPTTTTYVPRPEWYFFFLFELLRVVESPSLVFLATIGIPTICMILLILLPFVDRNPARDPRRPPIAMPAGFTTIAAMAYLTLLGAAAGAPTEIELATAPEHEQGRSLTASSGCLGCHKIGESGGQLGPPLTEIGQRLPKQAIARTLTNPTAPMPAYTKLQEEDPEKFDQLVNYLASLK